VEGFRKPWGTFLSPEKTEADARPPTGKGMQQNERGFQNSQPDYFIISLMGLGQTNPPKKRGGGDRVESKVRVRRSKRKYIAEEEKRFHF